MSYLKRSNMKPKTYLIIIFSFFISNLFSQNTYYYYKKDKRPLVVNTNYIYIALKQNDSKPVFDPIGYLSRNGISAEIKKIGHQKFVRDYTWYIIHLKDSPDFNVYNSIKSVLEKASAIEAIEPVIGSEKPTAVSDIFYIKLKQLNDFEILKKVAAEFKFELIKQFPYLPQWYYVKNTLRSSGNTLEIANKLSEIGLFESIDPGFMLEFKSDSCTSTEPRFSEQWGLSNDLGGPDIKACDAWDITKGNINVRVAVIDETIDTSHLEFSATLVSSHDLISGLTINPANFHGTHVMGIIGANLNDTMITGVAPKTGLMAINHDMYPSSTIAAEFATGIGWAVDNGADIINNSWGAHGEDYYAYLHSALLEDAISDAMTNGRGGLGTIVVFSAGNINDYGLDYPARSNPDILTVGAIQNDGQKSSFSSHGQELDVVAPGSSILSLKPRNGTYYDSGTSMAAPFVSGVAALLLSVNPCLTRQQVHDVLCSTAQKITTGSYASDTSHLLGTWGEYLGYGLVDAKAALDVVFHNQYLQNRVDLTTTSHMNYGSIYAGYEVDLANTFGNYLISDSAHVDIQSAHSVIFEPGYTANYGSVMTAHIVPPFTGCTQWPVSYKTGNELSFMEDPEESIRSDKKSSINVYPNPFKNEVHLDFLVTDNNASVSIFITDIEGRLVYDHNSEYIVGNHVLDIPINSVASMYFIKVCVGTHCEVKKIIKYDAN